MSRPGGFQNDDVARGAGVQLAKGVGLILVAIVIGIVLLQVVDDGTDGPVNADDRRTTRTTAATEPGATTTQPTSGTTQSTAALRPPDQVRVIVLNAGAATGAAGDMSDSLREKGYTTQEIATDWPDAGRTGNAVLCKPGFEREGETLAIAVGDGTQTEAFPDPAPPATENVDCVVAVGATG
jgi:hypothetical protein